MKETHFKHKQYHSNSVSDDRLYHSDVYLPRILKYKARLFLKKAARSKINIANHLKDYLNRNVDDGDSRNFEFQDIIKSLQEAFKLAKEDKLNIFEIGAKVEDSPNYENQENVIIKKVGFRLKHPRLEDLDIIIFLRQKELYFLVVTAYLNYSNDNHKENFNPTRYFNPRCDKNRKREFYKFD